MTVAVTVLTRSFFLLEVVSVPEADELAAEVAETEVAETEAALSPDEVVVETMAAPAESPSRETNPPADA